MAVVLVIARDWTLRTAVRAELRESGVDALGMESAEDVSCAIASGQMPQAVVLEATTEIAADPAVQKLIARVPTILIASRAEKIPLPPASVQGAAEVLYAPCASLISSPVCVRFLTAARPLESQLHVKIPP